MPAETYDEGKERATSLTKGHTIGNVEKIPWQRCRAQRNCHAHARVLLAEVVQIQNDTKVLVLVINKIK